MKDFGCNVILCTKFHIYVIFELIGYINNRLHAQIYSKYIYRNNNCAYLKIKLVSVHFLVLCSSSPSAPQFYFMGTSDAVTV